MKWCNHAMHASNQQHPLAANPIISDLAKRQIEQPKWKDVPGQHKSKKRKLAYMQDKKKVIYSLFKFKSVKRVSTADTTFASVAFLYNGNRISWIWTTLAMEMCTYQTRRTSLIAQDLHWCHTH